MGFSDVTAPRSRVVLSYLLYYISLLKQGRGSIFSSIQYEKEEGTYHVLRDNKIVFYVVVCHVKNNHTTIEHLPRKSNEMYAKSQYASPIR